MKRSSIKNITCILSSFFDKEMGENCVWEYNHHSIYYKKQQQKTTTKKPIGAVVSSN